MTQDQITKVLENTSVEEFQGLLEHLNKQKAELAALQGKNNKEMVKFYLDQKAKTDTSLAEKYPDNPQGKTIDDCIDYITNKASKMKDKNVAMVHHSFVFEWAVEYFVNDDIKRTGLPKRPAETPAVKMTPEEIRKKHDEWEIAHQKRLNDWIANHEAQAEKWEQKQKAKIAIWEAQHAQTRLFDETSDEKNPYLDEINPHGADRNPFLHETNPYKIPDTQESNSPDENDIERDNNEENNE